MAGITRTLQFSEGVSTGAPVTTFLQTTQFATYADDATFVTNKGSAAADGDAYYNTTLDVIRIYANGSWQSVFDDSDTNVALLTGTQTFSGSKTFSSAVNITDSTSSTDKDTGCLIVQGGVGIEENLNVGGDVDITGDLNVSGTTTTVNDIEVTDATITVNNGGDQSSADTNDAGIIVEMSDATDTTIHYDSTTTSRFKIGDVGSTVEIADISSSQVITNKDIDGGTASNTSRITLPKASTSTLDALTRKEGTLVFDTDINKVKYDDGTNLNELGGGAGGINYIENGDAEGGTTGWATYADAAATVPVDGTGGSPVITWTSTASAPLRDVQSFLLTKDAANRQGEGVSYDFNIDNADIHSVLEISFDADTSANYVDDDVIVYIYNTDSSNLIEPVPMELKAGEYGKYTAQFQTDDTDNSYRLIFHVSSTNANAYTVKIDNIRVGPPERNFGTPITDWKSFTATGSLSTNAIYSAKERRVGDSVELDIHITFSGATDAVTADIDLPYAIDTAKMSESSGNGILVGIFNMEDYGTDFYTVGHVFYYNTNGKFRLKIDDGDKTASDVTNTNPFTIAVNDNIWIKIKYPVLGWGSTVQMSDSDSTRIVSALTSKASPTLISGTLAGGNALYAFDALKDTHGSYSSVTGKYTCPVTGFYQVKYGSRITGSGSGGYITPKILQTGSVSLSYTKPMFFTGETQSNGHGVSITGMFFCLEGDNLFPNIESNFTTGALTSDISTNYFNVNKLSGPSSIAANELISCRYETNAGQSVSDITTTDIVYEDKIYDSHGAMNISNGRFTAPASGKYHISCGYFFVSGSWTATNYCNLYVYKNGSLDQKLSTYNVEVTATTIVNDNGSIDIDLIKDDYITIAIYQSSGGAKSLETTSGSLPFVSIHRIGF